MHGNFITATKQLMGRAFAQINSGITQCLHGLHVHVYTVCVHVLADRFDCSSDGGGRQDKNMKPKVERKRKQRVHGDNFLQVLHPSAKVLFRVSRRNTKSFF